MTQEACESGQVFLRRRISRHDFQHVTHGNGADLAAELLR